MHFRLLRRRRESFRDYNRQTMLRNVNFEWLKTSFFISSAILFIYRSPRTNNRMIATNATMTNWSLWMNKLNCDMSLVVFSIFHSPTDGRALKFHENSNSGKISRIIQRNWQYCVTAESFAAPKIQVALNSANARADTRDEITRS